MMRVRRPLGIISFKADGQYRSSRSDILTSSLRSLTGLYPAASTSSQARHYPRGAFSCSAGLDRGFTMAEAVADLAAAVAAVA